MPFIQGPQYSEKDVVVRERVPLRTERPPVREPGTYGNYGYIGQSQNKISSANIQEFPVLMDNIRIEGTEDQSVTSPGDEALGKNFHDGLYDQRRKILQRFLNWD